MTKEKKEKQLAESETKEENHHDEKLSNEPSKDKKGDKTVNISKKEYEDLLKCRKAEEKLLYVCADFDNYKKRVARDLQQQVCYANEKLIKEVLPIIDNLSRAKQHAAKCEDLNREQFGKFLDGIELVLKQLMDSLKKFGVEEVCSIGQKFDPNYHEAMDHRESDNHEHGVVVDEYQKGYTLNGRLIRPSKVGVSIKSKKEEEENG